MRGGNKREETFEWEQNRNTHAEDCLCVHMCIQYTYNTDIVGTQICLHSHIVGTHLPSGDKKQVTIMKIFTIQGEDVV